MEIITNAIISELKQATIAPILAKYQPSEPANALLQPNWQPAYAIEQLQQAELTRDAIQLIAHGLPVMSAIRWGLFVLQQHPDSKNDPILECVTNWLSSPNETLRIRAQQLAERVGLDTAPGWLGYSVFWSGTGSIVAPELPVVLPPDNMVGHAINAAILLSLVESN